MDTMSIIVITAAILSIPLFLALCWHKTELDILRHDYKTAKDDIASRVKIIEESMELVKPDYKGYDLTCLPSLIRSMKAGTKEWHDSDWKQIGALKGRNRELQDQLNKISANEMERKYNHDRKKETKKVNKISKRMPPGHVFSFDGSEIMVVGFLLSYTPEGSNPEEVWEWGPGWLCKWLSADGEKTIYITKEMAKNNNYWRNA